jgi:hypothetical protein
MRVIPDDQRLGFEARLKQGLRELKIRGAGYG